MDSALGITSGQELEHFIPGVVKLNNTTFAVLTGYEEKGFCFWCGEVLVSKRSKYCCGHREIYYQHFEWSMAAHWCRSRYDYKCANCGIASQKIPRVGIDRRNGYEVHHILPVAGGIRYFTAFNLPWNLIAFCHDCHQEVHAVTRLPKKKPLTTWEEAVKRGQFLMDIYAS